LEIFTTALGLDYEQTVAAGTHDEISAASLSSISSSDIGRKKKKNPGNAKKRLYSRMGEI